MSSALYFFGHPWISVAYWGIFLASLKGQGLLLRIVIELDMRMKNYIIVLGRRHIDVTPKR